MRTLYAIFRTLLLNISLAKHSGFESLRERLEVLRILNGLYLRSLFSSKEHEEVTYRLFGMQASAYTYKALLFLFKEIYVEQDYRFASAGDEAYCIVDCGANIGISVLYFKTLFPNATIIAFEPNPDAFSLLEKNIQQNSLTGITAKNCGLSETNDHTKLYLDQSRASLIGSLIAERGGEHFVTVRTEKLSETLKGAHIDLLKMDIEGAEFDVVNELAREGELGSCDRYIVEYHHRIAGVRSRLSQFLALFEDADYEYSVRARLNRTGEFQDILLKLHRTSVPQVASN